MKIPVIKINGPEARPMFSLIELPGSNEWAEYREAILEHMRREADVVRRDREKAHHEQPN